MNRTLFVILLAASACCLSAATISATLPEFNGDYNPTGPYPLSAVQVGTFSFLIPVGEIITGANVSGTFGNSSFPDTAGVDVYDGGILVASCAFMDACDTGSTILPFGYNFSVADLGALSSGSLAVTAVQTSGNNIRLGAETLTIYTDGSTGSSAVPEPATLALLGAGLLVMGLWRRKSFERI